jgi:type I restriction enzyme M protein
MAKTASASSVEVPLLPGLRTPKDAFRYLRNYLAGQFVGATRDDALLDEVLKCLFCKLYVERGLVDPPREGGDVLSFAKQVRVIFARVRKDFPDIYDADTEILLAPEGVATVIRECSFSLLDAKSDPIGDAFEVFVGGESRGRAGQFFTPRPVSDLLVAAVDPKPGETVIDPACGAGGFLTSVVRRLAATGTRADDLPALVERTMYGIDKDSYLVKLAKLHVTLLSGGHPHIAFGDSLALQNGSSSLRDLLPKDGFDVLVTNPPFGVRIVAANAEVLRTFELARKWKYELEGERWAPTAEVQLQVPPQVLFVERCLGLLRDGGRLGMVLPESLLSNKSYRHVVEYILQHSDVEAVIGMPEALFKTSGKGGTHTKTCLLVATKRAARTKRQTRPIFMAEAKWCGHDSRARSIPNNDLPEISANLEAHRRRKPARPSPLGFSISRQDIKTNVLCPRYYDPELDAELNDLRETHTLHMFGELVTQGVLRVQTGDELGKLAYGTGDIPFIRTSDISNWELKADPKHGVERKLYEQLRHKQDVRENDLLMVKDGTYLIGTCAIVTRADIEILYQSHLYKIRVNENRVGLDPLLLLAILSCPIVQRQIRSKQFTQDIIDSLGERIGELVLPVPTSAKARAQITEMVRGAVERRIEARELAKKARLAVVKARQS